ncbi:IPT/TIG domain-containing protein [Streptomyces sp. NBC_00582]|uniref:IPT/TIG domain-containing protein n=1 Tax=Streptomyces sp. NBC_00582 TaxID=2975783 RepID=UPI001062A564|nr:IPT/TIG domain-containing protein [Streptomyces sp. NBC_00582]WUB59137.1 IPT/TIG domain-containing protein [Streptomyces sp. NBC_00582]WUB67592.1 IPT/TIG domain-containing protein [Streptomyces sp. NBC_00582]
MSVATLFPLPPILTQPTLIAAVPGFGPVSGGNVVLLVGTNLGGATSVTFGGVPATIIAQDPLGVLVTVIAPAHAAGNVPVVVTTPAGASSPANYTYLPAVTPPPIALAITPASGPVAGGTPFTIIGANLTGASVTFGGVPATSVNVIGGVILTGVTPAHAAGLVTLQVTTPGGTTTVPGGFTYVGPAVPTAAAILPTSGPAAGGTPFAITGSNLSGATVTIGGVAATNVVVDPTGTVLAGITPAGTAGNAAVVVTTPAGSATVTGGFTYV